MSATPSSNVVSTACVLAFFNWLWRFVAIYAAIVLILLGALVLGFLILPLQALYYSRGASSARGTTLSPAVLRARATTAKAVRLYLWILDRSGLLSVRFQGFEQVDGDGCQEGSGVVFVANHPSLFDVLFFIARYPKCTCIVKQQLYAFSAYAGVIRHAGYLVQTRVDLMEAAAAELSAGHPLIVFPEGTRSDAAERQRHSDKGANTPLFHRGAAAIAVRSEAPLYPVVLRCTPPALGKTRKWNEVPTRRCEVSVTLAAAAPSGLHEGESVQVAARRLTATLERFFADSEQLQEGQCATRATNSQHLAR